MRRFYLLAILGGPIAVAGCGSPQPVQNHYPISVPATELRRILLGHFIDERPNYPCDGGPLAFPTANRFIRYGQFGSVNSPGSYHVVDGAVELLYDDKDPIDRKDRIAFTQLANGTILTTEMGAPHPLILSPIDADTPSISCGARHPNDRPSP